MNSCIKKLKLALTAFFILLPAFASAQNYSEVFDMGQRLWEGGACKEACTEFKRFIFVVEGSGKKAAGAQLDMLGESYNYLSLFYEQQNNLNQSLKYLKTKQNIKYNDKDILREINLLLKIAVKENQSLDNQLDLWCYKCLSDYSLEVSTAAAKAILYSYVECNMWDAFEEEYNQFIVLFPQALTEQQKRIVADGLHCIYKFKPKNPVLASCLSIIPGLGQLYAGDVKDSINAFLLNGSLIGISAYSLFTGGYVDFALLEMKPTVRFYKGNFYNAKKKSYEFNDQKIKKLKTPLLKVFEPSAIFN